jgi:predicted Rossmann-fold nucleotide-binding protein
MKNMLNENMIEKKDLDLFIVTDDIDEIVDYF